MAAVLRHGCEPLHSGSMQSFFHPLSSNTNRSQDHVHVPEQPRGIDDGRIDCAESIPQDGLLSYDLKDSTGGSVEGHTNNSFAHAQWDGRNDSSEAQDSVDADPSLNRRKRRKITPKKTQSVFDGHNITAFTRNTERDSDGTQTLASTHDGSSEGDATRPINDVSRRTLIQNVLSDTPKKRAPKERAPRQKQQQTQDDMIEGAGSAGRIEVSTTTDATPSKPRKATPKQKTLSLHTNGKLLSSPTGKVPAPDSAVTEAIATKSDIRPTSTRNFKMKNGKFVQTLEVILRYGDSEESRKELASKIDLILSAPPAAPDHQAESSKPHPFFTNKPNSKNSSSGGGSGHGGQNDANNDSVSQRKEPVAWKDIKFTTKKPLAISKSSETLRPIWPPLALQHVGMAPLLPTSTINTDQILSHAKHKTRLLRLREAEDVLKAYYTDLKASSSTASTIDAPQRRHLSGIEVANSLLTVSARSDLHEAILSVRSELISGSTAFDRGECAGPNIWPVQYAPDCSSEVLQPSASTLHTWLQSLAVHNVQSGVDSSGRKHKQKPQTKRKRRKPKDELDDFIVGSDDDDSDAGKVTKTAILIVGPHGCGKTASVFAVARELGFEVFEIHPGMRRSAKDILDKVGDMAHNHLVQKGPDHSRSSSVAPSDAGHPVDAELDPKQTSVANLFAARASSLRPKATEDIVPRHIKREQKQSLILFEEVDLLFEDDKGFWSGVQNLINHSKRPVVMTCNDPSSIPVDDLNLYDILTYTAISVDVAADYLMHIAASEGHIIDRQALATLYESKGKDLRASITELNFWCQMTVGSQQGGLDWMGQILTTDPEADQTGRKLRTFSQYTFSESLDLRPQHTLDGAAAMTFNRETLGIPITDWCDFADSPQSKILEGCQGSIEALERLSRIAEARSACELFDVEAASSLASMVTAMCGSDSRVSDRRELTQRYVQRLRDHPASRQDLVEALKPIMMEKATFPPSQGRLAPSIDSAASSLVTDVAPYVRFVACFDARTEQHRNEVFGSQGKARTTRAARAAAEGGDKAVTRTERWFPKGLDFDRVLQTAGDWPQWYATTCDDGGRVDMIDAN